MSERRDAQVDQSRKEATGTDDFYECTYCAASFGEWPGGCPECEQLVVRVVDARPIPDY